MGFLKYGSTAINWHCILNTTAQNFEPRLFAGETLQDVCETSAVQDGRICGAGAKSGGDGYWRGR